VVHPVNYIPTKTQFESVNPDDSIYPVTVNINYGINSELRSATDLAVVFAHPSSVVRSKRVNRNRSCYYWIEHPQKIKTINWFVVGSLLNTYPIP
jgi:hypothetical protein